MGLIKKGLLWGLLSSTSILIGMSAVAILFGMYPKKFTATLKWSQQWIGEPVAWILGWVPYVGDHLEAFAVSHGGGIALLVAEFTLVAKLLTLVVFAIFAFARFLRRRSSHRS